MPSAEWIVIIPVIIAGILRLLMEWQLRLTLAEIFQHASGGSVIVIRKRGLGGTMWIQIGSSPGPSTWPGRTELT